MRLIGLAAWGAAALPMMTASPAAAQAARPSNPAWWYIGQSDGPAKSQILFLDRNSIRVNGDSATLRVSFVFGEPQRGVKSIAISYALECGARRFRSFDAVSTLRTGAIVRQMGPVEDWREIPSGSLAALVLDAACFGRFPVKARLITVGPIAEANQIFAREASEAAEREPMPALPRQAQCQTIERVDRDESPRRYALTLSFGEGVATLNIQNNAYGLSGRYSYSWSGNLVELDLPNDNVVRYNPYSRHFWTSFRWNWTEDEYHGPGWGLGVAGNPNASIPVDYSAWIELSGDCAVS